jgi:hypothetical protein
MFYNVYVSVCEELFILSLAQNKIRCSCDKVLEKAKNQELLLLTTFLDDSALFYSSLLMLLLQLLQREKINYFPTKHFYGLAEKTDLP